MGGELACLMEGIHGWQHVKLPSVSDIVFAILVLH